MTSTISMTYHTVANLVVERYGLAPEKVNRDLRFKEDLGADSLDLVQFVMVLEDKFNLHQ